MRKVKNNPKNVSSDMVLVTISEKDLFVNAFCKMDIDSLVDLLDEDLDYGDENKWSFLSCEKTLPLSMSTGSVWDVVKA